VYYEGLGSHIMGFVKLHMREEKFIAPVEEFSRNPATWLREFAIKNGMGMVKTNKSWDTRLLEIAATFSQSEVDTEIRKAKVGWTDDMTKFVFPNVTLKSGIVDEDDIGLPDAGFPCDKLNGTQLPKSVWPAVLQDNNANKVMWSVLLSIGANILSVPYGKPRKKIGAIATPRAISNLATHIGLMSSQVSKLTPSTLKDVENWSKHDVPMYVNTPTMSDALIQWLQDPYDANILMAMEMGTAESLNCCGWRFIPCPEVSEGWELWANAGKLLQAIVQAIQSAPPAKVTDPVLDVAAIMVDWVNQKGLGDPTIIGVAAGSVLSDTLYAKLPQDIRFMYTVFGLVMDGAFEVSREGYDSKRCVIHLSETEVHVSKLAVSELPTTTHITDISKTLIGSPAYIKEDMINWVFRRDAWDQAYTDWINRNR
jgi:hypothetical protein